MSQTSALDLPTASGSANADAACDDVAPLANLCDEIVQLINRTNSSDSPYNQAEIAQASETQILAAYQNQVEIIDRLERLAEVVTDRSATSLGEVAAKVRAFNALTSLVSWDPHDLRSLYASMDRDRKQLNSASYSFPPPRPAWPGWLLRKFGGYPRVSG